EIASQYAPRVIPPQRAGMRLAGLEPLELLPGSPFLKVGERLNVAGSRKFFSLIKEKNDDEAVEIAVSQISAGAGVLDVNMDDAMLDSRVEMSSFLRRLSTEPEAAKVPVMIDSSDFAVVTDALETVQGKPIVNSISLKEGEEHFLTQARHIASMGAAMVVMAFDEQGQADTFERRIEVCRRAYHLLTDEAGIDPEDIIFDPNVLAIATGIDAHRNYAVDFLRALEWIKANLPGAKVSGGLSNLSFSFRGNNEVREAMHTVFLHHAIERGMDMAIVNPSTRISYEDLDPELREAVEDVIFNRSDSATDRLIELAGAIAERAQAAKASAKGAVKNIERSEVDPLSHLSEMVIKGHTSGIDEAVDAAVAVTGNPLAVIDGPLMNAMNIVGDLFGKGEMFLPQVVKSARTMSLAVGRLTPLIEAERAGNASGSVGKMLIATVKGDVHDIGKNMVVMMLMGPGYTVIDLGIDVTKARFADAIINY
ncbi:MAG: dihydropteroate synthase, partial [Paramuribaculum sp.]|nr:dihydropteroate synthase [Paramuribaculum sp.]